MRKTTMRGIRVWAVPLAAVVGFGLGGTNVQAQTTQKQWQLVKSGAQGYTLKLNDSAPVKQPAAGEVLVKMHAASLNRRDVYVMKGQYPMPPRDVVVPVSDGAGEVVALGSGAKRFKVGDRVMPIFFPKWVEGRPKGDATQLSLGGGFDGVLTQYFTISEQSLVAIPAGLSYEEAATLPCAGLTAYNGLITRGEMKSGDYVLLEGTGGVSIFGLQFALASGAKPIITSSSDEKLARAKSLGAVGGVNYKSNPAWEKNVREITNGAGVQQVLEVGGKDTLPHALASLGAGAHIALIGGLGGFGGDVPVMALMGGNVTVSGIYVGSRENFEAMTAFIAQHRLKPVIDKVFEFKDAEAAYQLMENGNFFGKIVIRL
jgi:NADPH:quinone reductase-like Zn-dependent oxidoreductase